MRTLSRQIFFLLILSTQFANAGTKLPPDLRIQFSAEPSQFDPLMIEDGLGLRLAANTWGTLTRFDGEGRLQNDLAKTIETSDDFSRFRIRFHEGLKWSDGVAFHADQFLLALRRAQSSTVRSALAEFLPQVDLEKTQVKGPLDIQVVLKSGDARFIQWCALPPFAPIRADLIPLVESRKVIIPTLGDYSVADYVRENHLMLKRHRGDGARSVEVLFLRDEAALQPLMKARKLDIVTRVPVLQLQQFQRMAKLVEVPTMAVSYFGFNVRRPPFDRSENRRAIRRIVDASKTNWVAGLLTGEVPADGWFPFAAAGLAPVSLVDDLVSTVTKIDESLVFQTDQGSRNVSLFELLQHQVKKEWKAPAEVLVLEWKEHYSRLKNLNASKESAHLFRFGWQNPILSSALFYRILSSGQVNNLTGWKSAEYDRGVSNLELEEKRGSSFEVLRPIWTKLEKILLDEAPVIPVIHQVNRFAVSKRVDRFRANPFGVFLIREIHFTDTPKTK